MLAAVLRHLANNVILVRKILCYLLLYIFDSHCLYLNKIVLYISVLGKCQITKHGCGLADLSPYRMIIQVISVSKDQV